MLAGDIVMEENKAFTMGEWVRVNLTEVTFEIKTYTR